MSNKAPWKDCKLLEAECRVKGQCIGHSTTPTPSQDWLDGIIDGIVDYVDSGHTGIGRPTTTISPEAAKKLITHRMNLERIDELKNLLPQASHIPYRKAITDRISKLEGESENV